MAHSITLIPGDGIGPEVSEAAKLVIEAAGVAIDWDVQTAGLEVARVGGNPLPDRVLESVRATKCALKGPCGTPIGGGFRSVNVTLRQTLDLYANVRPVKSLPRVETRFDVDMVIVRENTEGLYAGLSKLAWASAVHSNTWVGLHKAVSGAASSAYLAAVVVGQADELPHVRR